MKLFSCLAASPLFLAACSGTVTVQTNSGTATGAGGAATSTTVGPGGGSPASTSAGAGGAGGAGGDTAATSIINACVIATSCGTKAGWQPFTVGKCIDAFARLGWYYDDPESLPDPALAARLLTCATSANCNAVFSCFGGDWIDVTRCREGSICQGDSLSDGKLAFFDCGTLGTTCADLWSNGNRACCNATPCGVPGGNTCTGTAASFCGIWGERVDFDCGTSGRVCSLDPKAPCVGTGASCDPMSTLISCAGSVATYCSGGALATYDCSSTKFRTACAAGKPSSWSPCVPKGSQCDMWNEPIGCVGDGVQVCVNGDIVVVSCSSLGFASCVADVNGHARCVP